MSWRKFLTLLRGLSGQSASVAQAGSRVEFGKGGEKVNAVEGPKAAQGAFVALFGGQKPTG